MRGRGLLLSPYSRFFLRHTLRFRTPYGHGVPLPFQANGEYLDVEWVLAEALKRNRASLVLRNKDVVRLTTLEVRPKTKLAILLFRRSDPEAATPIFEDGRTRKLPKSDKGPDEAIAVSSHLFVHLGGITDAVHPSYHAILEEVPGLSRTYIQALMGDMLRDMVYKYTDRRGEEKETHTIVDFQGLKSDKMGGALVGNSIIHL